MHQDLQNICDALDQLADAVVKTFPAGNDQLFSEIWGWNCPSLNRHDAAELAGSIADDIRILSVDSYPDAMKPFVARAPAWIAILQTQTLPNMYGGNMSQGFPAYAESLRSLRRTLMPSIGWVDVPNKAALPVQLARRATAARQRLDELDKSIPGLGSRVAEINAAHAVAENLEVDLQALAEAREAVERTARETDQNSAKVQESANESALTLESTRKRADSVLGDVVWKMETSLDEMLQKASTALGKVEKQQETAEKLIAQCEAAYHITTTKGLAGAFDQRAASLAWSMRGWVAGLAVALTAGSLIGATRLSTLAAELAEAKPNWPTIVSHIVLSILGVGAPLWFSWLATKQIGQRFRLSEDYAFKASVAKAYEGYRKEAAMLDPEFQATLFRSALTRLDEAPLRLVEAEQHGSPWAEMFNSEVIKNALKIAPDLPAKMMSLANDTVQQAKKAAVEAAKALEVAKSAVPSGETKKEE